MQNEGPEPRVNSISVESKHLAWNSQGRDQGHSGSTVISWTLTPAPGEEPWTIAQAKQVTLLMRKELHRIHCLDAGVRGVNEPDVGVEALSGYDRVIREIQKRGKEVHSETTGQEK